MPTILTERFHRNDLRPLFRYSLAILFLLVTACTPVKPYWLEKPDKENGRKAILSQQLAGGEMSDPDLRVIEFDDQGDLWENDQRDKTVEYIRNKKQPLVIVYVHGWRHSASPNDSDLVKFNQFIKSLKAAKNKRDVVGVYMGWRGASTWELTGGKIDAVPAAFTIYNRKNGADRVASIPMSQTLWQINHATTANGRNGKVLLIGHSFGGRILERCVGQTLVTAKFKDTKDQRRNLPADLIILVNPASEGLYTKQLKQALAGWKDSERPGIISITSRSDIATSKLWGIAMNAFLPFRHYYYGNRDYTLGHRDGQLYNTRTEQQSSYLTSTAGHDPRLVNWFLVPDKRPNEEEAPEDLQAMREDNLRKSGDRDWFWISKSPESREFARYRMAKIEDSDWPADKKPNWREEANGYWILAADADILDGHGGILEKGGIFNDQMIDLSFGLFGKAQGLRYITPPKTVEEIASAPTPIPDAPGDVAGPADAGAGHVDTGVGATGANAGASGAGMDDPEPLKGAEKPTFRVGVGIEGNSRKL